jgi:chaperone modulatory protein CbpM
MAQTTVHVFPGVIFEHHSHLTVTELSRLCTVEAPVIADLVEEGILEAIADEHGEWRFRGDALRRALTALRLQRDLQINLPGVALVLELLDEREQLRRALRRER